MSDRFQPVTRIRPSRTSDDEGGYTEGTANSKTIYARIVTQSAVTSAIVRREVDVKIGDHISVESDI